MLRFPFGINANILTDSATTRRSLHRRRRHFSPGLARLDPSPHAMHRKAQHNSKRRRRRQEGPRAMITGLRGASIWSEDLNNLLPFYRDVLGLEVTSETPGFVVLGGVWLGTHSEVHGRNAEPARHMIGLTSNDLTGTGNVSRMPGWNSSKILLTTVPYRSRRSRIRMAIWYSCFNLHERLEHRPSADRQGGRRGHRSGGHDRVRFVLTVAFHEDRGTLVSLPRRRVNRRRGVLAPCHRGTRPPRVTPVNETNSWVNERG